MPELLLHIGTHKTGTTSIQRFCGLNRGALRERGIWYPPADVGRFPSHYAHHRIAHAIAGRDPDFGIDDARHFFERVASGCRGGERVLVSAEPMYRHVIGDPDASGKPSRDKRHEAHVRYARAVASVVAPFEVTVLVVLRRQDLFVESLYAEQILATGYVRPIETFIAERDPLLDYHERLAGWAEVFGDDRIRVDVYERSRLDRPIEQIFAEWLGLTWSDRAFEIGPRHNVTPTRALVEFKRFLNEPGQDREVGAQYRRWIEQLSERSSDLPELAKYYLQPRDRTELLERYAAGNREVARRYLQRPELFGDDVGVEIADYVDRGSLSNADFRLLTKRLAEMLATDGV